MQKITLVVIEDQGYLQFIVNKEDESFNPEIICVDFYTEGIPSDEVSIVDGDEAYVYKDKVVVNPEFVNKTIKALNKKENKE